VTFPFAACNVRTSLQIRTTKTKMCDAACKRACRSASQTIGKQAYDFLEAPRGKVWGVMHAVGGANDRHLPGFQSAFEAHGGRQTTEV
jgi:hypothetical protein